MTLTAGLHRDVPMSAYISDPCPEPSLSAGAIRKIDDKSPLAAWQDHPRLGGKASHSSAADLGSAAHAVVLEGVSIVEVVAKVKKANGEEIVPTTWATKAAKAARDEIRKRGKIPLLQHEAGVVYDMAKITSGAIAERVGEGDSEATAIWQEKNCVWGRARYDWLAAESVVDLKTSKSAEPGLWQRRALNSMKYDVSAAWYLRGLEIIGEPRKEYLWLVQETEPPYDYSWHELDPEFLDHAQKVVRKAIKTWGECLKAQKWPGYSKHIHSAMLPAWRAIEFDERELAEDLEREIFGGE